MRFEHVLTELLRKEFLNHQKNQSDIPDFFTAALKLAEISSELTRKQVVSDVAEALDCDLDALRFMFEKRQDSIEPELKFPCYHKTMIENERYETRNEGEDGLVIELPVLKAAE